MPHKEVATFCPANQEEWRNWLTENHISSQSVWLVQYKQKSSRPSITWSDAVNEALCFGWIDSTRKTVDAESFVQFFCKRKPTSNWSKVNKAKVEQLIAAGLMAEAGLKSIEVAKKNGSWSLMDEVEELMIPTDLEAAFQLQPGSADYFDGLSKSVKKMILQWVVLAKRPETRQKRITEIVELAAQKLKPKQFR
ncbi:YdeI/OmpD-associated family protein [Pedobacter gandavensis]|uniref:YdeI/OmpD-associated family protein n=1 Tax=Pedobacter gandavensis TaxID=2679963 RepID=UPI00292F1ACF|nr:YdeI/OmpD-associated family protein [Pedobacter gandavensis]